MRLNVRLYGALAFAITGLIVAMSQVMPTVGIPVASPASVTAGQAIQVTVTCRIHSGAGAPLVLPNGVSLLRLNASNQVVATLGIMRDDGIAGDALAGDDVFTLLFTANESAAGEVRVQCSAAFLGLLQRIRSPVTIIPVTGGASTDNTPPSVSIIAPVNGTVVSGVVSVTANPTDNVGVARVEFSAGGTVFAIVGTPGPYTALWDSRLVPNGIVFLAAKAYDAAGNSATASISATISNPPSQTSTISSMTPSKAGPYAKVKITGNGLSASGQTTVVFTPALNVVPESVTATEVIVRVPADADSGPVFVRVGSTSSNSVNFEFVPSHATPPNPAAIVRDNTGSALYALTDLLVTLTDFMGFDDATRIAAKFNGSVAGYLAATNTYLMRFPQSTPVQHAALADTIDQEPGVVQSMFNPALEPAQAADSVDRRYRRDFTEGRTGIWGWDRVQAIGAWRMLDGLPLSP